MRPLALTISAALIITAVGCDEIEDLIPDDDATTISAHAQTVNAAVLGKAVRADKNALFFGKIQPHRQTRLGFGGGGVVATVAFRVGEVAAKGETLAVLEQDRLTARKAELEETLSKLQPESPAPTTGQPDARIAPLKSQLAEIETELAKGTITAPYDCLIAEIHVDEGGAASPSSPIVHVLETGAALIEVDVPSKIADQLETESNIAVMIYGEAIAANVYTKAPLVNAAGDVRLQLQVDSEADIMLPAFGETIECQFELPDQISGFWLPFSALQGDSEGVWSILLLEKDASANDDKLFRTNSHSLELIHTRDDWALVRGEFKAGSLVVANGTHRIVSGQRVRVREVSDEFKPPQPAGASE